MELAFQNIFKTTVAIFVSFLIGYLYCKSPLLGFGVIAAGLVLLIAIQNWFLALSLCLLILPIQKDFAIGPIDFKVGEIFILPVIFIGICRGLIKREKIVWNQGYIILCLIYLSALVIGGILSSKMEMALGIVRKELAAMVFFFALSFMIRGKEKMAALIDVLLVSATCICLFGLLQYFTGAFGYNGGEGNRGYWGLLTVGSASSVRLAHSTFSTFNFFAVFIEFFFPLALMLSLTAERGRTKYFFMAAVLFVSLILSHSRGGLVAVFGGLIASLILYVLFINPAKRRMVFGMVGLFLVVAMMGKIYVSTNTDYTKSLNYTPRQIIWESCWRGIKDSPVFGVGLSEVTRYLPFLNRGYGTHNNYMSILLSRGVWGLFGFLGLNIFSLFLSLRNNMQLGSSKKDVFLKAINIGAFGGIVAFLIHSFFDDGYAFFIFQAYLFLLFWIVSASWELIHAHDPTLIAAREGQR